MSEIPLPSDSQLSQLFQTVDTWDVFVDSLPKEIYDKFGGEANFFLTLLHLNTATRADPTISETAFQALVAKKRNADGKIVNLSPDEGHALLEATLEVDLIKRKQ